MATHVAPAQSPLLGRPRPEITAPTDVIVKVTRPAIWGTEALGPESETRWPGRIPGHEGIGVVERAGAAVASFKPGDRVLISCINACGKCAYCRKGQYSHCVTGGWIIDGAHAEFVRVPYADISLYRIPEDADDAALVTSSDIRPTGYESGVLNGKVQPGSTVAIVGAGPVGLAALLTAQLYGPAKIIVIDQDADRLEMAKRFGATAAINSADAKTIEMIMEVTGARGVDTAIEAVGIPATTELCAKIVVHGGIVTDFKLDHVLDALRSGKFRDVRGRSAHSRNTIA
jgi:alcohol dehydrogenase